MRKFLNIDSTNTHADALVDATVLLTKVAAIVVGLGLIGLILWKLPIWEALATVLYFTVIPIVLLGCFGIVGWSTVKSVTGVVTMGPTASREAVDKIRAAWKKTGEKERDL